MLLNIDKENVNILKFNKCAILFCWIFFCTCAQKTMEIQDYTIDDLQNCTFSMEKLNIKGEVNDKTYFLKKKKFNGCVRANQGAEGRFFIFEILNGKMKRQMCWYGNGVLERDFNFKDGKNHGQHLMFYDDGSKYIEETYVDGKPIKFLRWYNNGKLAREVFFENGEKVKELLYER